MTRARPLLLGVLVALAAPAAASCSADDAPRASTSNLTEARGEVEVILTDPYCDVCTSADKEALLARSRIIEAVVELIDGARQSIDVAQFTFSRKEIRDALIRAHTERGVAVRIAMDAAQDKDGTVARELEAAGLPVHYVVGFDDGPAPGLQHAKFMIVDGTTLATGSNNWSSTGTSINEESTIVMQLPTSDPRMAGFSCHFDKMWSDKIQEAGQCSNGTVAFSPSSAPFKLIRDAIRDSEHSVDVLMHHLTFGKLVKELAKAAERGVDVRVVVNAADRAEVQSADFARLVAAGGRIRFKQHNGDLAQLMHHKLVIVDDRVLVNGSGNWSGSAFYKNWENYVRYQDPRIVQPFRATFHRLWTWALSAEALDAAQSAMEQHAATTGTYFGSLHAHIYALEDGAPMDDAEPIRKDEAGQDVPVDIPAGVAGASRYAWEYARDAGGLDFLALTPHCKDYRDDDLTDQANMSESGYAELIETAQAVTAASGGGFLAVPGMEWSTNSTGNHVNVLGSRAISKVERGRFDRLYQEFLPDRAWAGDRPLLMLNHPKTFMDEGNTALKGAWDQVYGVSLLDIPKAGERSQKFNDFGLDDFAPLSDVLPSWMQGQGLPDEAVVRETLANLNAASSPYARLMEVTLNRGNEFGLETPQNPSLVEDEAGELTRRTKVHSDWDYYLLNGFRLAPAASHDNHMANWGTGHTSRTGVIVEHLAEDTLLGAIEAREVFASEDQNLALGFYADRRLPMGSQTKTLAGSLVGHVSVADPDYTGPYEITLYRGRVGDREVTAVATQSVEGAGWVELALELPSPGEHFFYVEVLETGVNRAAWSAPIWVERL